MTGHVTWRELRLAGLALLALGTVALLATLAIPSARDGWAVEGPRTVPLAASVALIALAVTFLVRTRWRPDHHLAAHTAREAAATHWPTPAGVMAALVGYVVALAPLGHGLATAIFFPAVARVLGSDRPARDAAAGLVLGAATSYVFTRWLGVRLPVGPWGI